MSTLHDARADRRRVQHALERHPDRALLGRGPLEVLEHRPDVVEVVSLTRYLVRATLTTLWCNFFEDSSLLSCTPTTSGGRVDGEGAVLGIPLDVGFYAYREGSPNPCWLWMLFVDSGRNRLTEKLALAPGLIYCRV